MSSPCDVGSTWKYIETMIAHPTVRKKNLQPDKQYFFAVKPVIDESIAAYEYSLSSTPISLAVLSPFLKDLLPSTLQSRAGSIDLNTAIAGKVVGIYFSAHWCGPCRQYTPVLSAAYEKAKAAGKLFEVIFCSADQSMEEFQSYFSSMPWLAIPFGNPVREQLMGKFQVKGIPKLSILAPSGQILADNIAGRPLALETIDQWIASSVSK